MSKSKKDSARIRRAAKAATPSAATSPGAIIGVPSGRRMSPRDAAGSSRAAAAGKWIDGLTPDTPLDEALRLIFQQRWQALLQHFWSVISHSDQREEDVHQLRVASRRVAMVLDLLQGELPESCIVSTRKLVSRVRRSCGETRDLDVQILFLQDVIADASPGEQVAIAFLLRRLVRQRSKSHAALVQTLKKWESRVIAAGVEVSDVLELGAQPELEPQAPAPSTNPGQGGFAVRGVQTLRDELAAVWRCAEQDLSDPHQRHQLRIACKHLRYGVEVFMPILHESFRDEFYPQLQHLQDLLGEMQDAQTASVTFQRDRQKWHACCKKSAANGTRIKWRKLRGGISAVLGAYRERAEHAKIEFRELWPLFAGESFRIPVEEMLAAIAQTHASPQYSS